MFRAMQAQDLTNQFIQFYEQNLRGLEGLSAEDIEAMLMSLRVSQIAFVAQISVNELLSGESQ